MKVNLFDERETGSLCSITETNSLSLSVSPLTFSLLPSVYLCLFVCVCVSVSLMFCPSCQCAMKVLFFFLNLVCTCLCKTGVTCERKCAVPFLLFKEFFFLHVFAEKLVLYVHEQNTLIFMLLQEHSGRRLHKPVF